jgi:dephospho-CoA kinase
MILFGLTGGIASGKSTVAKILARRGIPIIDADVVAREVVMPGTDGYAAVVAAFGESILQTDGAIDRKALGARVFADADARKKLNAIIHPRIGARSVERAAEIAATGAPVACYEAALLVENGLADAFRPLVVVAVPLPVQVERLMARDGLSQADALARIQAQFPLAEKVAMADYVIDNDGTLADVEARTDGVLSAIRSQVAAPH